VNLWDRGICEIGLPVVPFVLMPLAEEEDEERWAAIRDRRVGVLSIREGRRMRGI
jgi:hypothetical protein